MIGMGDYVLQASNLNKVYPGYSSKVEALKT